VVARKDLEQAEAEAARTQAEVARAQARTSLYGGGTSVNQQLGLRSDMAGVVVERNLNPGQEVRTDSAGSPLFVVSDPSTLWVSIDAHEADVLDLRPGARVVLQVPTLPDQKLEAIISAVTDQIDPTTRTIKVRATVINPKRLLKSEMLATVRYERLVGHSVQVPATAVFLRGTQHYVFVQSQPGVFEPRDVKVSYEGAKQVMLSEGLKSGEQVVVQNGLLLARELRIAQDAAHSNEPAKP
jgi:cobalt-zinc-cadmium efflux system membrane fusion protein